MQLPMQWNAVTAAGPQWAQTFGFPDTDITGLMWEFVIRPDTSDAAQPPLVKVTATPSAQGQINIDTGARTVQVVLTPTATGPLGKGARPFALYSNPGDVTEIGWVTGIFNTALIAAP